MLIQYTCIVPHDKVFKKPIKAFSVTPGRFNFSLTSFKYFKYLNLSKLFLMFIKIDIFQEKQWCFLLALISVGFKIV